MLPFRLDLQPGQPVQPQVTHAVRRAVVSGTLLPGDRFPSVRRLSQELRINPNTAHKVVAALVAEGLLEVRPGIGTVVTTPPSGSDSAREALLGAELERLVVEARRLGVGRGELDRHLDAHWSRLAPEDPRPSDPPDPEEKS